MLRRSVVGILALALIWSVSVSAQMTTGQKATPKILDINSAPEADIAALGIDKAIAKKIVEGRPYRSKRELLTRELLTMEQYDKVKDMIIAKQMRSPQ